MAKFVFPFSILLVTMNTAMKSRASVGSLFNLLNPFWSVSFPCSQVPMMNHLQILKPVRFQILLIIFSQNMERKQNCLQKEGKAMRWKISGILINCCVISVQRSSVLLLQFAAQKQFFFYAQRAQQCLPIYCLAATPTRTRKIGSFTCSL